MTVTFRRIPWAATPLVALLAVSASDAQRFSEWSALVNLGPTVNSATGDFHSCISKDGLSLYFTSPRTDLENYGGWDIYVSQRASVDDPWELPRNLGPSINTTADEGAPILSVDGHLMYFASDRAGGFGGSDIYISRRHSKRDDLGWQMPDILGNGVNTADNENGPAIFEDDATGVITLYFDSNRTGGPGPFTDDPPNHNGNDIYASTLLSDGSFAPAALVSELSTPSFDRQPAISRDGLEMFLASNRPGTLGGLDLWVSTRTTTSDPWSTPVNLGPGVNSSTSADASPTLSFDGTSLYFQTVPPGGFGAFDLCVITRSKLRGRAQDK